MLWHITKREIYDHFTSLRFALTVGLVTLLMLINALAFVGSDYTKRLAQYLTNTALTADRIKSNCQHLNELATQGPLRLYKRSSPLAFCANDQEDELPIQIKAERMGWSVRGEGIPHGRYYSWREPWTLEYVQDTYQKNSMLPPVTALDWSLIIGVVLSFVAILFTFDAISGEREHGTLALALSNPVSRGTLLLGKFFGAFIAIAIPMLIGMLLSALIVVISGAVSFSGNDWARIGLMGLISLIYVALFIGLGLAISSRMEHSSTSLIVLLMIWVVIVVLVPNTLGSVVSPWRKVPPQHQFLQQKRATGRNNLFAGRGEEVFKYGSPSDPNPQRKAVELWAKKITTWIEDYTRLDDGRLDAQFAQVELGRQMLRSSPTMIYNYAVEALAGTGFQRHRQFVQAARQYREQFIQFIKETDKADPESFHIYYLKEGLSKKPVSFDSVPKFKEPTGVGVAVKSALMDMSLLVLVAGLCFMASYLAFLKCVVKCEAEDMAYHYPVPDDGEQPIPQEKLVFACEQGE